MRPFFVILYLLPCLIAFTQLDKNNRTLAFQLDNTEEGPFDDEVNIALETCMESVHFFQPMSDLETSEGVYSMNFIDIVNSYYSAYGIKVELQIAPINTVTKSVPDYLQDVAFDDAIFIQRFKALLDTVFTHLPDVELVALNIGNESDIYLQSQSSDVTESFKNFLFEILPYAKQLYFDKYGKNIYVGSTFTHHGLITDACAQEISDSMDLVSVTYYPLSADFTVKDTATVHPDFEALVNLFPNKPIIFAECGYPSSATCGSSEQKQADFYKAVFNAWDSFADNINYITVFKNVDWDSTTVDSYGDYYGVNSDAFKEYLRTLGIRTWHGTGTNKLAMETIRCELAARNWCNTFCTITDLSKTEDLTIHPNPTSGILYFKNTIDYEVKNALGELILKGSDNIIDLSEQPDGIYFIMQEGKTTTIIKQ